MRNRQALAAASALAVCLSLAVSAGVPARAAPGRPAALTGIHKIQHGIPPGACLPDPRNGGCVKPYASHQDSNFNEPHGAGGYVADVDRGKMDGFVAQSETLCSSAGPCQRDAMGYHAGSDIPSYWAYAANFALHDHTFEPSRSLSMP